MRGGSQSGEHRRLAKTILNNFTPAGFRNPPIPEILSENPCFPIPLSPICEISVIRG